MTRFVERNYNLSCVENPCALHHFSSDDFVEVRRSDGTSTCRTDAPAASLPLGDIPGVRNGVSGAARCALYCHDHSGCRSFNYRAQPLEDGSQCQLFTSTGSYASGTQNCQHFKVRLDEECFVCSALGLLS